MTYFVSSENGDNFILFIIKCLFSRVITPPPEKKTKKQNKKSKTRNKKQNLPPFYAEFSVIMYPRNLIVWGNQMGMLEFTSNMTYGF